MTNDGSYYVKVLSHEEFFKVHCIACQYNAIANREFGWFRTFAWRPKDQVGPLRCDRCDRIVNHGEPGAPQPVCGSLL